MSIHDFHGNSETTPPIDNLAALRGAIVEGLRRRNYPAVTGPSEIRVQVPYEDEVIKVRREHLFIWSISLWSNGRVVVAEQLIVRRDVPDDPDWLTNGIAGVLRSMWHRYDERQEARRRR